MKNILVVNVNWLGDVVFSTPVFAALKENFPHARLTCLALPRVHDILRCVPDIDEILLYDERGKDRFLLGKLRLVLSMRRRRFDAVFLLHRSTTRAFLTWCARIPLRVGFNLKNKGAFLTHKVSSHIESLHRSDHYLGLLESFGLRIPQRLCRLLPPPEEEQAFLKRLNDYGIPVGQPFVVIHPAANWALKRWGEESFALLIRHLVEKKGISVVISGSLEDKPLVSKIVSSLPVHPLVLTGQLTLLELVSLLKNARLVISADSGPLHMASALGADVIGLYGPTNPKITSPRGTGLCKLILHDVGCNRQACYYEGCPDNICMKTISVHEVLCAVHQILG